MKTKAIITSASNKYFPSLINLIGSLKENYPNHPDIYVYDIGLSYSFRKELEKIDKVHVIKMPHFVKYWRSCYTWKTYILNNPVSDLNFYIDSGCQILKPLDWVFEKIENDGYLLVSQGREVTMADITPKEYIPLLGIKNETLNKEVIAAGIFGFKRNSEISKVTNVLYEGGLTGLCLGFSKNEMWKNKGVNKNIFIRNCKIFRHDTSLISILIYKNIENPIITDLKYFNGEKTDDKDQIIWNLRMNYAKLEYAYCNLYEKTLLYYINRAFIFIFITLKKIKNG